MILRYFFSILLFSVVVSCLSSCSGDDDEPNPEPEPGNDFYFGADLSFANQILDHGGVYREGGNVADPYQLFADHGNQLVRLRLFNNPAWTKEVYGAEGDQLYNDLADVEKAITRIKAEGMKTLLDFHYSDTWADPDTQEIPEAWQNITSLDVLEDSVYQFTFRTLKRLSDKGLAPEFVQIGNEINCGMLYTNAPANFPKLNSCNGNWANLGTILNAGIKAVRDVSSDIKIILHVADPANVQWWFDQIGDNGHVSDYDIIGFSYYPLWHTSVSLGEISSRVSTFKSRYHKDVMILEIAYPWTTEWADDYNNHFGSEAPLPGYPKTVQGQYDFMVDLTKEVKEGNGIGVIYWEPDWITSDMKDLWGTGSSWENSAFFDFDGNVQLGIEYMEFDYE